MPIFALLVWPVMTIILFRMLALRAALIWGLLLGYLFLPEAFAIDLPGLPALEKNLVIAFSLLLALLIFREKPSSTKGMHQDGSMPRVTADRLFHFLIIGLVCLIGLNSILTIASNREVLVFGPLTLTALRPWDIVSDLTKALVWIIPFLIGRKFLSQPEDHRHLLKLLVISGLIYAIFILVEVRLSPQLHNWVYGYHQHSFEQHVRGGQFRPKVFLAHGLSVGIFLFMTILAAGALWFSESKENTTKWLIAGVFLFCLLAISRNLGALAITLMLLPIFLLRRSLQLKIVATISIMFLTFPALRQADLVPVDWITSKAAAISAERAQSFEFRIGHEDALLQRAAEKPLSGWGGWGRSRVYDSLGNDLSVTDGLWIIVLGTSGWLGYIAMFGLLVTPLVFLRRAQKRKPVPMETAALALMGAGVLIYLVPNSHIGPIGWLIAGAIAGFVQYDAAKVTVTQKTLEERPTRRTASYTRFPKAGQKTANEPRFSRAPRST